jgi:hypothetical protein
MSLLIHSAALSVLFVPFAGSALAQQSGPPIPAATAASGASTYRSVFKGYRAYGEEPLQSWREANERVRSIGGWQAYAREAQGAAAAAPAKAGSAPHTGGHSGHKKP